MKSVHLTPGFTSLQWLLFVTLLFCLALAFTYKGVDRGYHDAIDYVALESSEAERVDRLFRYCLRGKTIEVSRPGCKPLAQFIINEANAAESGR